MIDEKRKRQNFYHICSRIASYLNLLQIFVLIPTHFVKSVYFCGDLFVAFEFVHVFFFSRQLMVMDETYVINQMKEDVCYVSTHFNHDMKIAR